MKIAVMALSGGMDSTSLLLRLLNEGYQVYCISYEYGQKHRVEVDRSALNIEYLKSKNFDVVHEIVDLQGAMSIFNSSLLNHESDVPEGHYEEEQMKSTVVPNRNAIFSSILYGYALSIAVKNNANVTISHGLDPYSDIEYLMKFDLIIQSVTMSEISTQQEKNLVKAVRSGVGFAGAHGGLIDSFRNNYEIRS